MTLERLTIEGAHQLATGPFGREFARLPELYAAPIHVRSSGGVIRNGTTFFLDCGRGPFGVTARHVYDELVQKIKEGWVCYLGLHAAPFDLAGRLISKGSCLDIATYRVQPAEIAAAKVVILNHTGPWPPPAPHRNQGLVFAGYPGIDRLVTPQETEFVGTTGSGVADSVNDRDISCLLDREHMLPIEGKVLPPVGVDLRGMSGAPVLAVTSEGIFRWHLAGVVHECTSGELMEMIKIARADFIGADGEVTK